jgi:hypothetical protein
MSTNGAFQQGNTNPHADSHSLGQTDVISHDDLANMNTSDYNHLTAAQLSGLNNVVGGAFSLTTQAIVKNTVYTLEIALPSRPKRPCSDAEKPQKGREKSVRWC